MARRGRPASESYQSVCCPGSPSVSLSSGTDLVGLEDEEDQAPIFSLSKSSMDVVMVSGLPHKRDPVWARRDLRRSSSTNTHAEQNSVTLQQLHPQMWQQIHTSSSQQISAAAPNVDMHSPPVLSERWITNMQRWSGCSASTQSRSSTPDTIVWKDGSSRPTSLTQETPGPVAADSLVSKPTSPPTTPSAPESPQLTPASPTASSSILGLNADQQKDIIVTLPTPSPPQSPKTASTSSSMPSSSPYFLYLTGTEDESFQENNMLSFTFPSPIESSASIAEGGVPSDAGSLIDDVIEDLRSPGVTKLSESGSVRSPLHKLSQLNTGSCPTPELLSPGSTKMSESGSLSSPLHKLSSLNTGSCRSPELQSPGITLLVDSGGVNSPVEMPSSPQVDFYSSQEILSPGGTQLSQIDRVGSPVKMFRYPKLESERGSTVCHLELPCQAPSFPAGQGRRLPLVTSLSDSQLGGCCKCNSNTREGFTNAPNADFFREGGTMTSRLELVDAAVQTISPVGSLWGLRRNTSNSNMGSQSLLGSPPGSRLNLKSSVGSNSNLVSPSSSMFPVSSGEEERHEDDPAWEINSPTMHNSERRRSCLKMQSEMRDKLHRRSSMKQVQWDEEGMTWDIHGTSVDPEVLSTAIRKHLELRNSPQQPAKRPSKKKKKAPKPPLISNVVKAMTPELNPPGMIISSTCMVEADSEDTAGAEKRGSVAEKGGSKKEETEEVTRRISRAEANDADEEDEVYGEEGTSQRKSPSHGSGHSRKRSVIRSLRPGWCGGSKKTDD